MLFLYHRWAILRSILRDSSEGPSETEPKFFTTMTNLRRRMLLLLSLLCHFHSLDILSCSVVSNSCNPMDYSPPGSFVHGDSPGRNTGVGCHALLRGIFPTQGSNPGLPHCRQILYYLSHQGSPYNCIINNNFLNPMCQYVGKVNLSLRPSKRFLS